MKKVLCIMVGLLVVTITNTQDISKSERALQKRERELRGGARYAARQYGETAAKGAAAGAVLALPLLTGAAAAGRENTIPGAIATGAGSALKAIPGQFRDVANEVRKDHSDKMENLLVTGLVATAGASIGAAIGVAIQAGINTLQLRRINNVLQKHNIIPFKQLSAEQAMLVIAAYQRKLSMLKVLTERESAFIDQPGVWDALAELAGTDVANFKSEIKNQRLNRDLRIIVKNAIQRRVKSAQSLVNRVQKKVAEKI